MNGLGVIREYWHNVGKTAGRHHNRATFPSDINKEVGPGRKTSRSGEELQSSPQVGCGLFTGATVGHGIFQADNVPELIPEPDHDILTLNRSLECD